MDALSQRIATLRRYAYEHPETASRIEAEITRLRTGYRPPTGEEVRRERQPTQTPRAVSEVDHPAGRSLVIQPRMAPDLLLVPHGLEAIAAGAEDGGTVLDFSLGEGYLIGMRGSVAYVDAAGNVTHDMGYYFAMEVQIAINGREHLISFGQQGAAWAKYSDLFSPTAQWWTPIMRHLTTSDVLHINHRNVAAAGDDLTPSIIFSYRSMSTACDTLP